MKTKKSKKNQIHFINEYNPIVSIEAVDFFKKAYNSGINKSTTSSSSEKSE